MILEMGMDWMRLPWVTTVEIILGRLGANAAAQDRSASKGIEFGESTTHRDLLVEWLSERPKTPEEIAYEEDDAILAAFGMVRPKVTADD